MARPTARHCRPDSPLMCSGRRYANEHGPGVWFSDELRTWLVADRWGIVTVTHCPFCRSPLPLMGTAEQTQTWLDVILDDDWDGDDGG